MPGSVQGSGRKHFRLALSLTCAVPSIYTRRSMQWTRRSVLKRTAAVAPLAKVGLAQTETHDPRTGCGSGQNVPSMVEADGKLRFDFGEEHVVLDGGLQPFLFSTASGTLILQAQSPNPPFPSPRMHYAYAMTTSVSRDGGKSWTVMPLKPGENGLNLEGGAVQMRDGSLLAL